MIAKYEAFMGPHHSPGFKLLAHKQHTHIVSNARQLGPRQVGPYVKTTRTVLLFYNIVQYLYVYNY
jgi:hypothetical protein